MFHKLKKLNVIAGLTLVALVALSFSSAHPTTGSGGYTSAPGDNTCASSTCHSGSNVNLDGEVFIEGLPSTIMAGEDYTITVRITNPNGNAAEAGFQLLALNGTNGNAGSMVSNSANTSIKVGGGKNYFGHQPSLVFPSSNEISHTVVWTAPSVVGSVPEIKFYAVANIADGNNARTNDRIVFKSLFLPIDGSTNPLVVDIIGEVNPTCFNSSNGSATAVADGGTGTYTYQWSSGQTTATATNLPGGISTVTVSDGVNSVVGTVNLTTPDEIIATASSTSACQGINNGSATISASGGTGLFTYLWNNGATASTISNLGAGNYTVTVRDGNLCTNTASTTVTISPPINVTGTVSQVSCNGNNNGSISTSVTGGTPPFTYLWTNGQSTSTITNLAAGTYTVTVTDASTCTKTASYTVTQQIALASSVNVTSQVLCNGGNNGSATLTITGGSPNYSYTWSTGLTGSGSSATINNLTAGSYAVTVVDGQNCSRVAEFTITQPMALVGSEQTSNVSCKGGNDGSINVVSTGGTLPYTYLWSSGQTTQNLSNLTAGSYTLTTKDANQCQIINTYTIAEPALLDVTISTVTQISCSGSSNGSLMASPIGGNGGYTYSWTNGASTSSISNLTAGTYKVTVIDTKGCQDTVSTILSQPNAMVVSQLSSTNATCSGATNGSVTVSASNTTGPYVYLWVNGQTSPTISNVSAGSYAVTVTDANNCTTVQNFSVGNGAPFQLTPDSIVNVICFGESTGSASIIPQGSLTYLWSTGATTTSITQQPAGTVSVIGTDAQGCKSDTLKMEIRQLSPQMSLTDLIHTKPSAGMNNGIIEVVTAGGTLPLTYNWKYNGSPFNQSTRIITGLNSGLYELTIVDSLGCSFIMDPFTLERISSTDEGSEFTLKMYPNPVSAYLNIESIAKSEIHIFNQNGKLVNSFVGTNDKNCIDVSNWPNGLYYLKIKTKGKYLNGRFTILH